MIRGLPTALGDTYIWKLHFWIIFCNTNWSINMFVRALGDTYIWKLHFWIIFLAYESVDHFFYFVHLCPCVLYFL